jgi:hypothetical protein
MCTQFKGESPVIIDYKDDVERVADVEERFG